MPEGADAPHQFACHRSADGVVTGPVGCCNSFQLDRPCRWNPFLFLHLAGHTAGSKALSAGRRLVGGPLGIPAGMRASTASSVDALLPNVQPVLNVPGRPRYRWRACGCSTVSGTPTPIRVPCLWLGATPLGTARPEPGAVFCRTRSGHCRGSAGSDVPPAGRRASCHNEAPGLGHACVDALGGRVTKERCAVG